MVCTRAERTCWSTANVSGIACLSAFLCCYASESQGVRWVNTRCGCLHEDVSLLLYRLLQLLIKHLGMPFLGLDLLADSLHFFAEIRQLLVLPAFSIFVLTLEAWVLALKCCAVEGRCSLRISRYLCIVFLPALSSP